VPRRHVLSPIAVSVGAYRRDLPAREGEMKTIPERDERKRERSTAALDEPAEFIAPRRGLRWRMNKAARVARRRVFARPRLKRE